MLENTELKKKISRLEEEKLELKQALINIDKNGGGINPSLAVNGGLTDVNEIYQMK
jgi:hypothetical protein